MLSFLALVQASAVRGSICEALDDRRFCVLVPSVSSTTTLSRSGDGSAACESGRWGVSECQPHTIPMVTLVLPDACIESILLLRLLKPVSSSTSVSGIIETSEPHCLAGNSVPALPEPGVVSDTSFDWPRSITQPVH